MAPYELSDPSGVWGGWNWVEADGSQHAQYGSVQALDKSYPYAASQLTVTFQARAASTAGLYASAVEISADNFGVAPQTGVAPVVVSAPTATVTPTPTPSATVTSTATDTPAPPPTETDDDDDGYAFANADRDRHERDPIAHPHGDRYARCGRDTHRYAGRDRDTDAHPGRRFRLRRQHPARRPRRSPPTRDSLSNRDRHKVTNAHAHANCDGYAIAHADTHATPVAVPLSTVWVGQEPHGARSGGRSRQGLRRAASCPRRVGHRYQHRHARSQHQPGERQGRQRHRVRPGKRPCFRRQLLYGKREPGRRGGRRGSRRASGGLAAQWRGGRPGHRHHLRGELRA